MAKFGFHPVIEAWFGERFKVPTNAQQEGWPSIASGKHTLIAAPTGSGKTLAAFLALIDRLFKRAVTQELPEKTMVVYVSPLRALSNDIHHNLETPLAQIEALAKQRNLNCSAITTAVRTGDTPTAKRQAMIKKPPHILVTTPESLYLLLTSLSGRNMLQEVETVIVDEIHALAESRRGTHLTVTLERLASLTQKPLQRVGLSATQSPIETVAKFLTGQALEGEPVIECTIIDQGHLKTLDLAMVVPKSPLEAVISHEVWAEIYRDLADRIQAHRTTLVFVQTRSLTERVTFNLGKLIGEEFVAAHHGSISADMRHRAENDLKTGALKAVVATASLELGIDIGFVEQVCQIGSPKAISAFLQRVGRSGHHYGGIPKGRLYPLSRDQLLESTAMLHAVAQGQLDKLIIPMAPLDILAQQIVACVANQDWNFHELFRLFKRSYPFQNLETDAFDTVVQMLADGISTRRGRRGAHIYFDAINQNIKGRRGARLMAITNGGSIPDNLDYKVVLDPEGTYLGTLNEDFAIESSAGDIFQLGNNSWRIAKVETGVVRVHDAHGLPPTIPFWFGDGPGRSIELCVALSNLREKAQEILENQGDLTTYLVQHINIPQEAAEQLSIYLETTFKTFAAIPSQNTLVMERFFDEGGGMHLILHAPFGSRVNRGWGLALRKRFCRSFNFELQAAATDDAILLSLGPTHAFPLDDVFNYLNPQTVRDVLIQALLDAPMFQTHFRWNAQRSLAISRQRGGKRVPPYLQRMAAEDLIAVIFPDQLACLENIAGDREVPEHPIVTQTIEDCLHRVMDIDGLVTILEGIRDGRMQLIAMDLPEPSPMAHDILNASVYAFLDDAGLEERRTHAVQVRRSLSPDSVKELGQLDTSAIDLIRSETWPSPRNADELHEALLQCGCLTDVQIKAFPDIDLNALQLLLDQGRVTQMCSGSSNNARWIATEREPLWKTIRPASSFTPKVAVPQRFRKQQWEPTEACLELLQGYFEVCGPVTASQLAMQFILERDRVEGLLLQLEGLGIIMRGHFDNRSDQAQQWCHRSTLARIHRRTLNRLRAEIQPVTPHIFMRFLFHWQKVEPSEQQQGIDSLMGIIETLEGFEAAGGRWESDILPIRLKDFTPSMLDQLCLQGRVGWGRRTIPAGNQKKGFSHGPLKTSPIAFFSLPSMPAWFTPVEQVPLSPQAATILKLLEEKGALFFHQMLDHTGWLHTQLENIIGELVAAGMVRADSFSGLRALLTPSNQRPSPHRNNRFRRTSMKNDITLAGRWSVLRSSEDVEESPQAYQERLEHIALVLLRRFGIIFRKLLDREGPLPPWRDMLRVFRRLEARGEIRGGHFVRGFGGEHFALPEAITKMRKLRREEPPPATTIIHATDPLNLLGIILPGPVVPQQANNRIIMRDGLPVAARIGKQIQKCQFASAHSDSEIEALLKDAGKRDKKPKRFARAYGRFQ